MHMFLQTTLLLLPAPVRSGALLFSIETVADLAGPAGLPATEPTRWNEELPPADDPGATEKFEDAASGVFEVEALAAEGLAPIAPPAPFCPPFQTSEEALRPAAASPEPPPELADEPLEMNFIRAHALAYAEKKRALLLRDLLATRALL